MSLLNKIWYVLGVLSLIYFAGIVCFTGLANRFHIVWVVIGIACLVIGHFPNKVKMFLMLPMIVRILLVLLLVICIGLGGILEGCVLSGFIGEEPEKLDYIIVLGAQVKKEGMSKILKQRTQAAGDYLLENPDTIAIVSGGQGYNEPMSEAEAMKEYLVNTYHISENRIICEDKSTSTVENIAFSKQFVPLDAKVGIVTSNFHTFRAGRIAKKAGFINVYTIPSFSELPLLPSNMIREALAILKDFMLKNI